MVQWIKHINWLGIDVALGAGAFSFAVGHIWEVPFQPSSYLLLILVVWLIYAYDHLRDIQTSPVHLHSERRKFHERYANQLSYAAILVIAGIAPLLIMQPRSVLLSGSLLACGVAVYFLLIQLRWLPKTKEFTAALFYAAGIVLVPGALGGFHSGLMIHAAQIFFLALANLWIFAWFDREADTEEGFTGLLTDAEPRKARMAVLTFVVCQLLFTIALIMLGFHVQLEAAFLVMQGLLAIFMIAPEYWKESQRFRTWGDAMFFLPLISLLGGQL